MRHFSISEVAALADLPVSTIRDWFNSDDGAFSLKQTDRSAPAGGTRRLGPFTTLAVLIAAQLTRLGVPISHAAPAGMKFAYTQSGSPKRGTPGAHYRPAMTLLSVDADGQVQIFPASTRSSPLGIVAQICAGGGATVLHVDPIIERLEKEMNEKFGSPPAKAPGWR